jgi:P2-related tail formation protein
MANDNILATGIRNRDHLNVFDKMAAERYSALDVASILVYLIDIVKADALPVLGEQFDVMGFKGWLLTQTEQERRDLIKKAIELHRYKGTPWAVKEAIKRFGFPNVEIQERIDDLLNYYTGARDFDGTHIYGGAYHWALFRVIIDITLITTPITSSDFDTLRALIDEYKNVRSHLLDLSLSIPFTEDVEPTDELSVIEIFNPDMVDDVTTQYLFNGQLLYNGQNQYDFDQLDVTIINVSTGNALFDYDFDFDLQ